MLRFERRSPCPEGELRAKGFSALVPQVETYRLDPSAWAAGAFLGSGFELGEEGSR